MGTVGEVEARLVQREERTDLSGFDASGLEFEAWGADRGGVELRGEPGGVFTGMHADAAFDFAADVFQAGNFFEIGRKREFRRTRANPGIAIDDDRREQPHGGAGEIDIEVLNTNGGGVARAGEIEIEGRNRFAGERLAGGANPVGEAAVFPEEVGLAGQGAVELAEAHGGARNGEVGGGDFGFVGNPSAIGQDGAKGDRLFPRAEFAGDGVVMGFQ